MADQSPFTVTCDSLDEFEDDATGFVADDLPARAAAPTGFPGPAALAAAKALWVDAIRRWVTPAGDAPDRFVANTIEPAHFEVTVRVGCTPIAANSPAVTTLRATAIDTSSDQFVTLMDGSHSRAVMWTDVANIAFTPTCAGPLGPAAAG
jgi:hypothetical protein